MQYIDKLKDNPKLAYYFRKVFHLTSEDMKNILSEQEYKCLICLKDIADNFVVDHDHNCCPPENNNKGRTRKTCGKCIRGLLCPECNKAIGLLKEDPATVARAEIYVSQNKFINRDALTNRREGTLQFEEYKVEELW